MPAPTAEQQAFLRQKLPANYIPVRPAILELQAWLASPAANDTPTDKAASARQLVGLPDPESGTSAEVLAHIAYRACEAIKLDRGNAAAYFMLARAMTELGRFDDYTYHAVPLREAIDFAEKSRLLAPKVGKAWRSAIELYIRLYRYDMAAHMLDELNESGCAPGTHASLQALLCEVQGYFQNAIQWLNKSISYASSPSKRAELLMHQALDMIELDLKHDADNTFYLAMMEGGPQAWVAHNWSVLKHSLNNWPGCVELNRRALIFDPKFEAAVEMNAFLQGVYAQQGQQLPLPASLQEERLRGMALPGCDDGVLEAERLTPWRPPARGTRARMTRTFRSGLAEGE
ncbi:MAG: hypothetical protein IT462_15575 [Planctomycetes bacterium]|nr:hypothetical protein [Planctomycetota bacterium]